MWRSDPVRKGRARGVTLAARGQVSEATWVREARQEGRPEAQRPWQGGKGICGGGQP